MGASFLPLCSLFPLPQLLFTICRLEFIGFAREVLIKPSLYWRLPIYIAMLVSQDWQKKLTQLCVVKGTFPRRLRLMLRQSSWVEEGVSWGSLWTGNNLLRLSFIEEFWKKGLAREFLKSFPHFIMVTLTSSYEKYFQTAAELPRFSEYFFPCQNCCIEWVSRSVTLV